MITWYFSQQSPTYASVQLYGCILRFPKVYTCHCLRKPGGSLTASSFPRNPSSSETNIQKNVDINISYNDSCMVSLIFVVNDFNLISHALCHSFSLYRRLSRICTLLSLGRIFPSQHTNRLRINLLIALFAILYIICVILTAVQCDISVISHSKSKFCLRWSNSYPVLTFSFTSAQLFH